MNVEKIIALFHEEKPKNYVLNTVRSDDEDSRWVLDVQFEKDRYMIKIASNGFTNAERINGWVRMIEEFKKLGYYSPAICKSCNGKYSEETVFNGKACVVWEEEFARYHLRDTLDKSVYTAADGMLVYRDEVLEFLAKVGEKHYDFFPYPSAWVRFEPYSEEETTDEITACVETFDTLVDEKAPQFKKQWERILRLFTENKEKLMAIYQNLPTSVFQADEVGSNLILDDNSHFVGVIDYNISGKEVVLNRLLSAVLYGYSYHRKWEPDIYGLSGLNRETYTSLIGIINESFEKFSKHYTFCEAEAAAAPLLFKYIYPIEYTQINALEKYADDDEKLQMLFDYMEYVLTSEEIDFKNAMRL